MRWLKRILLVVVALLLAVVLLLALVAATGKFWQRKWAPSDNGISLTPKYPILKPANVKADSAFDLLRRATAMESKNARPPELRAEVRRLDTEEWSNESFPFLTKALAENEEALALARRAAVAPNPQVVSTLSLTTTFPELTPAIRITELLRASAARMASTGDLANAYTELEMALRFAQILTRGGVLIQQAVEITCDLQVCATMRVIAQRRSLPGAVASRATANLLRVSRESEPLAETIREETPALQDTIAMVFRQPASLFPSEVMVENERPLSVFTGWGFLSGSSAEASSANLTHVFQQIVEIASEPYSVANAQLLETLVSMPLRTVDWFRTRDPVGLLLAKLMLPIYPNIYARYYVHLADLKSTAVVLALHQFEKNRGHQAETLQELVPDYLPRVPLDPFDGHELRYQKRALGQSIVYSVGPDQTDDGGLDIKPHSSDKKGDLVFSEGVESAK